MGPSRAGQPRERPHTHKQAAASYIGEKSKKNDKKNFQSVSKLQILVKWWGVTLHPPPHCVPGETVYQTQS